MREIKSFEELYQELQENNSEINTLYEEAVKEKKKQTTIKLIVCIIIDLILMYFFFKDTNSGRFIINPFGFIPIIAIDFIIIWIISLFGKKQKAYRMRYKQLVIRKLIENFYDNVEYFPEKGMPRNIYNEGQYNEYYNRYYSDDYIEAKMDGQYLIDMAEVKTVDEETHTDSDGNTTTSETIKFHGLFSKIVMNKSINSTLRITPNTLFNGYKNKLEMDSSEFEKSFNVYASNSIIGMQLLTSDIMEEILDFKSKTNKKFDIYIDMGNIYLRFQTGNMFEVKTLKQGAIDEKNLRIYYEILSFVSSLSRKIIQIIEEVEI